jgi:hypothetical protein
MLPILIGSAAAFLRGTRPALLLRPTPSGALSDEQQHGLFLCGLTFELRWPQRCGALGLRRKIGRRPSAAGPVCHAVGAQLERGVRPHSLGAKYAFRTETETAQVNSAGAPAPALDQ